MPSELDRPRPPQPFDPWEHKWGTLYEQQNGFLVIMLGVSMTAYYEPDGEKAMKAVADKKDMFLMPCVRVRSKK